MCSTPLSHCNRAAPRCRSMRVVSAADVTRLLPMADAIPLMAHAFRLFSSGTSVYPLRTHVRLHNPSGDALAMPANDGTDGLGVRLVTGSSPEPWGCSRVE